MVHERSLSTPPPNPHRPRRRSRHPRPPLVRPWWNRRTNPARFNRLDTFVWRRLFTGLFGLYVSIVSLLSIQIQVTSSIVHMVLSAMRGVAESILGPYVVHTTITVFGTCALFPSYEDM
jgi:hypothetical protein